MWCSISTANRLPIGRCWALAVVLATATPFPASSADSLPQPALTAPGETILLAVTINGLDSGDVVPALRLPDGGLAVPEANLRAWRLILPASRPLMVEGRPYFRLADIAGVAYRVDAANQTLLLQAPSSAFGATALAYGGDAGQGLTPSSPGGFLNYDLQWQRVANRDNGSGLFEAGAFNAWGSGTATGLWNSASLWRQWVRLDTTWNVDMPDRMQSLRLGDAIGRAASWGRSVRFGGVQWATNFSTQPGFITFPLPTFRGEAALPSTLDVFVNNSRQLHSDVQPGPFDLTNVPMVTGQGEVQLVVRDLLGRQQVITQPYYVSPRLLKPGLHDFSYEAGAVREDYGVANASYGRMMLAATDRLGITPGFTRELRAEILRDQQTLGAGGAWLLPRLGGVDLGTASLGAAVSHGPAGGGQLVSAGAERQARDLSVSLQTQYASREFVQLGQLPGFSPRRTLGASLGFPVGGSGLGLSYLRQSTWEGNENRLLTASYSLRLGAFGQLGFYALRNFSSDPGLTVGFILTHALDDRTSGSAEITRAGSRNQATLQLQRNLPAGEGFGYRLLAGQGDFDRYLASGALQTERGTITAEAARFAGVDGYRAGFSGGIAIAGGGVFASRRIDDSFAVVKVGDFPGVRVYRDNQEVARTDAHGLALVTRLRAYQANPIGVDQGDLPLDAQVDTLELKLTPALRSGVVVAFPVRRSRGAAFRLVGEDGVALPPGAVIRIEGDDKEFPVGYDGRTFATGLASRNRVRAEWAGRTCVADMALGEGPEPLPDLGTVICKGTRP